MTAISRSYWEDSRWAHAHSQELSEHYPNQWVAIYNKQVVTAGRVISDILEEARRKAGDHEFVVFFSEKGIHIYRSGRS